MPSMNPDLITSWAYAQNQPAEPAAVLRALARAAQLGVEAIDPAGRSQLQLLCTLRQPRNMVELGAGVGVASLALLESSAPNSVLTAIEPNLEHALALRQGLREAGLPSARARIINEKAENVLGRLADGAYDLVLVDAGTEALADYVAEACRLVSPHGLLLVNNAFDGHRLGKPAVRRESTLAVREMLRVLRADERFQTHLLPSEQGLFVATVK